MIPSQFRALSWEDKAEMMAHDLVIAKMNQYDIEQAERDAKRKQMLQSMQNEGAGI
jgi:hypothetical protein